MASIELINELLESGVHYGHQTKRWNPKMREFILEEKNDIYIIDVSQAVDLDHPKALEFLREDCRHVNDFFRRGGERARRMPFHGLALLRCSLPVTHAP